MSGADPDPLERLLSRAQDEGLLDSEGLGQIVAAFRQRAERLLAERIEPLERSRASLETEVAWLREQEVALKQEREAQIALSSESRDAHDRLLAHHRGVIERLIASLHELAGQVPGLNGERTRERLDSLARALSQEVR